MNAARERLLAEIDRELARSRTLDPETAHWEREAMRWAPVFDEPIVRDPIGWRVFADVEGMDGYAAQAYSAWLLRDALRTIGARVQEALRPLVEAMRRIGEQFAKCSESLGGAPLARPPAKTYDPFLVAIAARRNRPSHPGVLLATEQRRGKHLHGRGMSRS